MKPLHNLKGWPVVALALTLALAACSSTPLNRAPVEDRGTSAGANAGLTPAKPLRGIENAGKPGYFTVRPGDTVMKIARENNLNWRDIVQWNSLENPGQIEVGEVLRITPPDSAALAATAPRPGSTPVVPVPGSTPVLTPAAPAAPAAPAPGAQDMAFIWPSSGALIAGYDEIKNKGLDMAGKAGDPVLAAADGKVVYAGANVRGYGNLIIVKHNDMYLSAYAHNQALLVKEDQNVRKGQKIAEMGNSDADRVKLHFEIRKQGKPVDPAKYLPPR